MFSGPIDVRWFGMKADWDLGTSTGSDNTAAFMKAIEAAENNQVVTVPNGNYYVEGSIILPLASVKKVILEIYGNIYFKKGSGFVIEGPNQIFKSYGIIAGRNIGAVTAEEYASYQGTGIYLKNAVSCDIQLHEVKDFEFGIHMTGYKSGGEPTGSKYNRIKFNAIHHCKSQIRISIAGSADGGGNWNYNSSWRGGQLGRGPAKTYGKGGWIGVEIVKESNSNSKSPVSGHTFYDVGFEGLEKAIVMSDAYANAFIGGRFEGPALREGINLHPETAIANQFIGHFALVERFFMPDRLGVNTIVNATPLWSGTTNQVVMGTSATNSVTPGKLLAITNKYGYTNFIVNQTHDLISLTGQYPTIEAMKYRIDTVMRAVPYKQTYFEVKPGDEGASLKLPPNIGIVIFDADENKELRIDTGDLVRSGESFLVDYNSPAHELSFVKDGNNAKLISPAMFPSAGLYQCLWVNGQYKVSKLSSEYQTFTQTTKSGTVSKDIHTYYVNYRAGSATIDLPAASLFPGRRIAIKNIQALNKVEVNGISPDDEHIITGRGGLTIVSDGKTWNVIAFYGQKGKWF